MIPQILADRWLRMGHARLVSGVILALVTALVTAQLVTSKPEGTTFGPTLGGDYVAFYTAGLLLNREPVDRLYDLKLQDELLHRTIPAMPGHEQLPFVNPPFLAPLFVPLARLSFPHSYATWLVLSLAIYAASVGLMLRVCINFSSMERSTVWLLALSFEPFAIVCWMGGQLSILGCLAIAVGLTLRRLDRPILSGLALSALLYKPTLAFLIVPLMVVARRWRMLGGFATGAIGLALASLAFVGEAACLDFARLMAGYGRGGASATGGFLVMRFVDLRAFLGLMGIGPGVAAGLAVALALPAMVGLALAWSRADCGPRADLAWSAALCFTPVVNLYGPIYDVSIVVPGLILAAAALRDRGDEPWPLAFRWLLALLYLSALVSPAMAQGLGFQPVTPALAAMGAYLIRESLRGLANPFIRRSFARMQPLDACPCGRVD